MEDRADLFLVAPESIDWTYGFELQEEPFCVLQAP